MTNAAEKKSRSKKREHLLNVMKCVQFLGRQGIPFQGNHDGNDNFAQLMHLIAGNSSESKSILESDGRGKYLHNDVQNELVDLMARQVLSKKLKIIKENVFFGLMGDEYTDISNKEQLSVCIRTVNNDLEVEENFLGFYEINDIKSDTIVDAIKDVLLRCQLELSMCRGQTYDGASNMLGKKSGVATQILTLQPTAFVTHCHGHSLSLAVKFLTSSCKIINDTMGVVGEICILIKYSPKREKMLGSLAENIEGEFDSDVKREKFTSLSKLCPTRWTVRASCFEKILNNYDQLILLWEQCLQERLAPDVKSRIIGCNHQMRTFQFFFGLCLGHRLFSITDHLSKTLQHERMSAVSSQVITNHTIDTISSMRSDESFNLFYELVLKKSEKHSEIQQPSLSRKRNRPNYATILQFVEGNGVGSSDEYPQTINAQYKKIYFEAIDNLVEALKDRFQQPSYQIFSAVEELLIKSVKGLSADEQFQIVTDTYENDLSASSLKTELLLLKTIYESKNYELPECFSDLISVLKKTQTAERKLIPNIFILAKILLVNAATSATAERSFSLARRLKTWIRSTMSQKRFNSLAILNIYKDLTDTIEFVDVGNKFIEGHPRRQLTFGKFV